MSSGGLGGPSAPEWKPQSHASLMPGLMGGVNATEFIPGVSGGKNSPGARSSGDGAAVDIRNRTSVGGTRNETSSPGGLWRPAVPGNKSRMSSTEEAASSSSSASLSAMATSYHAPPAGNYLVHGSDAHVTQPEWSGSTGPISSSSSLGASTMPSGSYPASTFFRNYHPHYYHQLDQSHRPINSMSLPESAWRHQQALALESRRELDPDDPRLKAVPPTYTSVFPLDDDPPIVNGVTGSKPGASSAGGISSRARSSFGYPTSVFKVQSREDGRLYCLRRIDNAARSVSNKIASAVRDAWAAAPLYQQGQSPSSAPSPASSGAPSSSTQSPTTSGKLVDHPNVVRLYKAFVSQRAVFFVHGYHPGARTVRERFFHPVGRPMSERMIWSMLMQLVSAIRAVHASNLAVRTLQLNHVLVVPDVMGDFSGGGGIGIGNKGTTLGGVSGSNSGLHGHGSSSTPRLRVNCVGVVDALEFESRKPLADLQREDMACLGRIALSLASGTEIGAANCDSDTLSRCGVFLAQNYSRELHALTMSLLGRQPPPMYEIVRTVSMHTMDELDTTRMALDRASEALAMEYDAGRALRLLLKMGFVNERPEFGVDSRWSETGDCYVLKLFRDYVFHQADEAGRPVMDLGHIITALNKLDAADEERIVLASRDGKSLLVVTFADVARCLEGAFGELCAGAVPAPTLDGQGGMGY